MQGWVMPLIAAPFVGSLLGVLIRRLPAGRPVALSRSACDHCDARLGPVEMVPLLSYVAQGGRCRHCGGAIGRFHLAVELAACAVAALVCVALMDQDAVEIWSGCALGWALLALAWIDAETWLLPDALTLPLLLGGLGVTAWRAPEDLPLHAGAALAAYLAFRGVTLCYRWLRGREGLGEGDAKLLASGGAWVGLAALPWVVVLAGVLGLAVALLMARRDGLRANLAIPFGPPLALSIWIAWLYMAHVTV